MVPSPSLQSGNALFGEQRRKTKVESKESGGDENFLSSEMARNRESVCDHHRNPEAQGCTERGSHQETFERKERRERAVESIRSGRTGVCRCSGELTGAGDERGAWEAQVSLGLWSFVTRGDEVSRLVCSVFVCFSCTMAVASPEH